MNEQDVACRLLEWLLLTQNGDGSWSTETDTTQRFLVTNRVCTALLTIGCPPWNPKLVAALQWLHLHIGDTTVQFEDRANALEAFLLASDRQSAHELLQGIVSHIELASTFQKQLFPVFVLDLNIRFGLRIPDGIRDKLVDYVLGCFDSEGTIGRNLPLTSYAAHVLYKYDALPSVTAARDRLGRSISWIKSSWHRFNGDGGWDTSIAVNAYLVMDLVEQEHFDDQELSDYASVTVKWCLSKIVDGDHLPDDSSFAYSVRNTHYCTALVLLALDAWLRVHGQNRVSLGFSFSDILLGHLSNRDRALQELGRRYEAVRRRRSIYPLLIGMGLGAMIVLLVTSLMSPAHGRFLEGFHIVATVVALVVVVAFEVARTFMRERERD